MLRDYLAELVLANLQDRTPPPVPDGLSVEALCRKAREMQMAYLLLYPLLRLELPDEERDMLRANVLNSVLQTRTQLRAIEDIGRLFEMSGIRHQFLKGSVLKHIYPRPECREMSDIDVMVYSGGFSQAGSLLLEQGFVLKETIKHHQIYTKSPFLLVELHWALYDKTVDRRQSEYYMSFDQLRRKKGFSNTCEFSEEDFYVYLVSHIARHFYSKGCGIRNLVDVFLYCSRYREETSSVYVAQELEACGLTSFERNIRALAFAWLGEGKEEEHFDTIFNYMCNNGIYGRDENGIWSRISQHKKLDAGGYKRHLHKWYFFPPLSYMEEDYPWLGKYRWLLPWAWVMRAVTWAVIKKDSSRLQLLKEVTDEEVTAMQGMFSRLDLDFHKSKS